MSDKNVGGLVIQWRHNAQGCGRGDAQAAATWRSCARQLEAALSAHGQPVVDEALVERAARALDPVAWAVHDGAHPTFKQGTSDHSVKTTLRLASIALTAALEGADHE